MPINVINKYKAKTSRYLFIGRPSPLGNPFDQGTREDNIKNFRVYILKEMKTNERIARIFRRLKELHKAGHTVHVCCTCAPLACHGDVIKEIVENDL